MYAIVKTGGKQIKAIPGEKISVEKLASEAGDEVVLEEVLMVADGDKVTIGTPTVAGAVVKAKVVEQIRDKKIIVFKKKRRHNYRRKQGHRQYLTVIEITEVSVGGKSASSKPAAKKADTAEKATPAKKAAAPAKKPAAKKPAAKKAPAKKAAAKKES